MTGDNLLALGLNTQKLTHTLGHIAMAGAVESVAAHTVLGVELIGKSIHIGIVGHRLMESGIEDTHLRNIGQERLHGIHTLDIGRIVERSQVIAGRECLHHLGSEANGLIELLTSVHHAMAHGIQFTQILEHSIIALGEHLEDKLHTGSVLLDGAHDAVLLTVEFHGDE